MKKNPPGWKYENKAHGIELTEDHALDETSKPLKAPNQWLNAYPCTASICAQ